MKCLYFICFLLITDLICFISIDFWLNSAITYYNINNIQNNDRYNVLFRWLCVNACGCDVDLLILAKVKTFLIALHLCLTC